MSVTNMLEKIKAEIERRREKCADIAADSSNEEVAEYYRGKEVAYDEALSFIESLEKEPRDCGKGIHKQEYTCCDMSWMDESQRLEEAALKAAGLHIEHSLKFYNEEKYHVFKAGAKWMAEQGETVEGEIVCAVAHPHENKVIARVNGNYKFGDKVIVQIRKAD